MFSQYHLYQCDTNSSFSYNYNHQPNILDICIQSMVTMAKVSVEHQACLMKNVGKHQILDSGHHNSLNAKISENFGEK